MTFDLEELEHLYGWLILNAGRHCHSKQEAEDLAHDVYLRAVENRDKFKVMSNRREEDLKKWLTTMTRNLAINKYQSADYKRVDRSQDLEEVLNRGGHDDNPEVQVSNTDLISLLNGLLNKKEKEVMHWRCQKYTHHEIAGKLDMPSGTVGRLIQSSITKITQWKQANDLL